MILFVWGKNTLYTEALPLGLDPSPTAKQIGFETGDQLITVDGKKLDNVLEINKLLFLRSVESVTVKHSNGKTEQLSIPENFGNQMFESGELMPFSPVIPAIIDSILPNSVAAKSGLMPNDKLISVDDSKISNWTDFKNEMADKSQTYRMVYERNRSIDTLQITSDKEGKLGVYPQVSSIQFTNEKLGIMSSIEEGISFGYWNLHDYIAQFKYIFTKKGASQLGGFGAIGNMFPATWDWKGFWASTALISIILAFMNILPIPALDGGHVMFLAYEIITGKKPNDKFMEYAQMFGFFLLLALVLYANGNDLYRLIFS
mgnify:FL=1